MISRDTTSGDRPTALEALRVNTIVGRARLRLSQAELAARAGISRPTISRIERASASDVGLETIQRIARALRVSIVELLVLERAAPVDDVELARRAAAPADEFISADDLIKAIDEANRPIARYSRAGRPSVVR